MMSLLNQLLQNLHNEMSDFRNHFRGGGDGGDGGGGGGGGGPGPRGPRSRSRTPWPVQIYVVSALVPAGKSRILR